MRPGTIMLPIGKTAIGAVSGGWARLAERQVIAIVVQQCPHIPVGEQPVDLLSQMSFQPPQRFRRFAKFRCFRAPVRKTRHRRVRGRFAQQDGKRRTVRAARQWNQPHVDATGVRKTSPGFLVHNGETATGVGAATVGTTSAAPAGANSSNRSNIISVINAKVVSGMETCDLVPGEASQPIVISRVGRPLWRQNRETCCCESTTTTVQLRPGNI